MTDVETLIEEAQELRAKEPSIDAETPTFECEDDECDATFATEIGAERHYAEEHL
jgi:hypothetical protein